MDILIDTNVLLDVFLQRQSFQDYSEKVFRLCVEKKCRGIIAAHSFTDMFYLMRKFFERNDLRELLLKLTEHFEVSSLDKRKLQNGLLRNDFTDFEDCLQDESAIDLLADYIITRNTKDFENSRIPAITPEEFIKYKADRL